MKILKSYSKALYDFFGSSPAPAKLDEVEKQLGVFTQTLDSSKELQKILTSPIVSASDKATVVKEICSRLGLSNEVTNFIRLVAEKNRMDLFSDIAEEFSKVRLEAAGELYGSVVSADPMTGADLQDLSSAFSKKLGKKVYLKASTDAQLLAGLKVTVNGVTYDGTLRSQISQLRERLVFGKNN